MNAFAALVSRSVRRNRRRFVLTTLSVAIFVFLLCVLLTVVNTVDRFMSESAANPVIGVGDRYGNTPMPQTHVDTLRAMGAVRAVMAATVFVGQFRDEQERVSAWAADHDSVRSVMGGFPGFGSVADEQYRAFEHGRLAALVGKSWMLKYGWHIGDTVTLRARLPGRSRPLDVRLEIAGVIPSGFFDGRVILHRDYFQELSGIRNVADVVLLTAATLASVPELCRQIEGAFLNSSMPVRAITTEQFFSQFLSGVNLRSVIALVTIVLIAATTAVTLNSLAMSIRERRREVAVLKTLGYTPFETLLLLVAEAMWMTLAGGVIGSVVAFAIFSSAGFLVRVGPLTYFEVPVRMVTYSVVLSLLIGVLAAIGPAARVSWLPIVRGLRDVR